MGGLPLRGFLKIEIIMGGGGDLYMKYIKSSGFSTVHLSVTASHRIQSRSEDLGTFKRRFPGGS